MFDLFGQFIIVFVVMAGYSIWLEEQNQEEEEYILPDCYLYPFDASTSDLI